MSQCPHCFVGQCQKHRLQDHGKREMLLKAKMTDPKAAQRRLYDSIVTKQLDKLEAASRAASAAGQVREIISIYVTQPWRRRWWAAVGASAVSVIGSYRGGFVLLAGCGCPFDFFPYGTMMKKSKVCKNEETGAFFRFFGTSGVRF